MGNDSIFEGVAADHEGQLFYDSQLRLMPDLFGYFYKVIWDIISAPRKNKKGKKNSYAIVVSCCNRGEGASTIALNLTAAFSRSSVKNTILVDGNLRGPMLHSYFSIGRENGLTEILMGEIEPGEAVREVENETFHFISAGRKIDNPILLYEATEFKRLLDELRNEYELIIFDSAPIIRYPETPVHASAADGLVLVLQAESTSWEVAAAAKTNLEKTGVNVFGAILNKREYYIPPFIYKLL